MRIATYWLSCWRRISFAAEFVAHGDDILCAALNPSTGRTLATGGEDKRVNLWLVGQSHNITVSRLSTLPAINNM